MVFWTLSIGSDSTEKTYARIYDNDGNVLSSVYEIIREGQIENYFYPGNYYFSIKQLEGKGLMFYRLQSMY